LSSHDFAAVPNIVTQCGHHHHHHHHHPGPAEEEEEEEQQLEVLSCCKEQTGGEGGWRHNHTLGSGCCMPYGQRLKEQIRQRALLYLGKLVLNKITAHDNLAFTL
jgi:hypothetical protein